MKAFLLGLLAVCWSSVAMGQTLYTFNGGGTTGNWTDPSIWTTDPTGSTAINQRAPKTGDNVVVTNSFVVTLSADIASTVTGLNVTVQRGGVLDLGIYKTPTLNSLSGQGVLRIKAAYFPTVTTNNFDDANTGTVEFYDWSGNATLPNPASRQYNSLRLLNTTATAYVAQLDNNLTLNGNLTLTRTNNAAVTLNLGTGSIARTLSVQGDINVGVGTTLGVNAADLATDNSGVQTFHTLNAYGSFTNSGTVNLHNGTTNDAQTALLNFTGGTNANFACNSQTDLDILKVDKGVDSQVLLNITAAVKPGAATASYLTLNHKGSDDFLQLFNGIAKLGSNIYLAKISNNLTNGFSLGENLTPTATTEVHNSPTLWIAGATVLNDNCPLIAVYGTYRISGGQFSDKYDAGMVVREDGQVLIEGGTTSVNKFRPSRTSASHRGSFIISGGLFECTGTTGTSVDDKFARFCVPYVTQAFRMTGGIIRTQVPNTNGADGLFHIGVNPNNAIITGGTVEVILPASAVDGKILTTSPLWNLTIKKTGTGTSRAFNTTMPFDANFAPNSTTAAQPLTVLNNLLLDATNAPIFDAGNQLLTIQGTFTLGAGSTYLPGTNTTLFSGGQDQQLVNNGTIGTTSGSSSFNNWTINKPAGTLTLGGSVRAYTMPAGTTLAILSGVLNDNDKTINVLGNLYNSASHTSGGRGTGGIYLSGTTKQTIDGDGNGVFGSLILNNSTTPVAVQATANLSVSNVLTFNQTGVFDIGANRLFISNVSSSALRIASGKSFSSACMIQTAGNQSDPGVQKSFGANNSTFFFPVGASSKFMPATIQFTQSDANFRYGQVSVSPAARRSPFAGANSLPYYWKVRSAGFDALPASSVALTFTMTNADVVGNYDNYIPARYTPTAWATNAGNYVQGFKTDVTSDIQFVNNSQFEGEYTAGESGAFGPITSYYSAVPSGNWETPGTWRTGSPTGPTPTVKPEAGNPVFITGNSVVTVTAASATSGSLVIDNGSTLDLGVTTGHNFGALPDAKVGGSGTLRLTATPVGTTINKVTTYAATPAFPGGDFGSFIKAGGGTVEYYGIAAPGNSAYTMAVPATSATSLALTSYENLTLNPYAGSDQTLPNLNLRVYTKLQIGSTTGYTGTANISGAAAGNLQVGSLSVGNGKLRFANGAARTLAVDGDVLVGANGTFDTSGGGTAVANAVTVGGSVVNNGTLDFNMSGKTAALTFTGSANATLTSGGSTAAGTNLYSLTLNKGMGRAALLRLDGSGILSTPTPSNGWLTLTNGTLYYAKPGATLNIHDGAATPYLITDNAGLTVDAPGGTVTVATTNNVAADLQLAGQLQILQGTLKVGSANNVGNDVEYASAGAPGIKISGGNLYVNGQIRRTVTNLDGALRFDQSGGTIDIDGQGATAAQSNERGLLEVQGKGSIFRLSGGNLNLHRSNQKNPILTADLYLAPDSTVVTGGVVNLGNATSINKNVIISVSSTVPLYDLQVVAGNSGSTNTGLLTGVVPLTLKGSLTISNDYSAFNANGLGLNIAQHLVNNNSSADPGLSTGGFIPVTTTQLTTFTGGLGTQQIIGTAANPATGKPANLTTFGSLTLNTSKLNGTLQLGGNAQVAGTLTLAKGRLDDNDQTITALGDVLNSATHTSGGNGTGKLLLAGSTNQNLGGSGLGTFGNVTLSNAAGATTTANQQIDKVLTLTNGVFTISSNLLWLTNPADNTVVGYDATRYIRTNGIVADLGLRKNYPSGASNFTFPLGSATKYAPVVMNVTANAAAGYLTVQPVDLAHPSVTDPAVGTPNKITYYWKVSSTLSAPTVSQQFTYDLNDIIGTESTYVLGRFVNGAWTPIGGIVGSSVNTATHTLSNPGYSGTNGSIDGDYTGGAATEFGDVPTFYSRTSTAGQPAGAVWTSPSAWTNNADGSDPAPTFNATPTLANPVVISRGHLITSAGNGLGAANLRLDGTLDLGAFAANNFNTVRGSGTVRIGSALFPAGNYAAFVAPGGGTVDYSGAVQLPARDTYNNLTFSGGNGKKLSNLDLTINGSLTLAANTTVDNPTSQSLTLTSATSGATLGGTFNLNDGSLTTGAFLTNSGTLNLGAGLLNVGTTFTNASGGVLNNGTGNVAVSAAFSNVGTYNANVNTGALTAGSFANSGTYTAGLGKLLVNNDFANVAGGVFTTAAGGATVGGNFSNAGSYRQGVANVLRLSGSFTNSGSFSNNGATLTLYGDFTNSGTFTPGASGLVQFITEGANRYFTGSAAFFDVQKVGSAILRLNPGAAMTVNDVLTMRDGLILTGTAAGDGSSTDPSNTVLLTNASVQPIVGASLTSYVAGRLAMVLPDAAANSRVFPVGLGSRYRPVVVTPQAASSGAQVLVEIFNSAPANNLESSLQNISANRYYRIQLQSGTLNQPTVQLSFNTDTEDEKVYVPGNLRVARATNKAGQWSSTGGGGVWSPEDPRGYTNSGVTTIDAVSLFALASTNRSQNPLTGTAPLPVQLLSFAASRQGTAVRVVWATASEVNSAHFLVQRSADGRTFATVEKVAALGTSLVRHDYTALDAKPLPGLSYYRLMQVDKDGTSAYSPVVAVRFDGQSTPTLVAYPNPTAGQRVQLLTAGLPATGGTVRLLDNVGRVVLTQVVAAGTAEATLEPAQPLASGLYIATWQTADGLRLTTKVVVD